VAEEHPFCRCFNKKKIPGAAAIRRKGT